VKAFVRQITIGTRTILPSAFDGGVDFRRATINICADGRVDLVDRQ
jgi:hypothetical protein